MLEIFQDPAYLISLMLTLIISISVHEFAHAKSAELLGDDTARLQGRVTLNPLMHLDPIGTLMMLFGGFGWGRPVPVDPYRLNRRSPAALMLVSIAGPASNFLLALLAAVPLKLGFTSWESMQPWLPSTSEFFITFIFSNLYMMLFNLVPLYPLDGDKIADYFFPPFMARPLQAIRPMGPMILIMLIFVTPQLGFDFFDMFVYPPVLNIFNLLIG